MEYSNLGDPSNTSGAPRRECVIQGILDQEALVLVSDENDVFSYRQLLMQLSEMQDQVDPEEVLDLLTKIVDVQLPERKGFVKDNKVVTDGVSVSLEDSFRKRVICEFPSLCEDSLSHDGPDP